MSTETKTQNQGNYAGTIGLFTGVVVFFAGKVLFPASSGAGPRALTLMAVAAGAAFLVTLVISLVNSPKK